MIHDPELWRRVEEICQAALDRSPNERTQFLNVACGDDGALRQEVEAVLAREQAADGFLAAPVAALAANAMDSAPSGLLAGCRLGPYQILSRLGAGGMGVVYRARDTVLGRDVAIKVLPTAFLAERDRAARFDREARVLAALNHPHIAAIYGVERSADVQALVLELVEGHTLAERLERGPLSIDEALVVGRQIAEALDAAHEKGIVHRDLKPANIKITPGGVVKVLDFGLAAATAGSAVDVSRSPAFTLGGTSEGVVLGTAAYMSPEQARGQAIDKRTDIWAFGCVLFEMLTGRLPFPGATVSDHIAAILEREPDWNTLPASTPEQVRRVIRRCLEKDIARRLRDIGDTRMEIEEALTTPTESVLTLAAEPRRLNWILAVGGTTLAIAIGAMATMLYIRRSTPTTPPVTRFTYRLPEDQEFTRRGRRVVAISPDGKRVAYIANEQIYVRELDQLEARPVAGSTREDPLDLVFSPDGQWIAYFAASRPHQELAENERFTLKKIAVSGGSPVAVCETGWPFGASWRKDTVVFAQNDERLRGVQSVSAAGGTPRTLLTVAKTETVAHPFVLDDEGRLIFTLMSATAKTWDDADIVVQAADGRTRDVIVHGGRGGRVLTDGHLTYIARGTLFAATFDMRRLASQRDAVPVLVGVAVGNAGGQFDISDNGSLVFVPSSPAARTLVWVDRQGHEEPISAKPQQYIHPRLSPDGSKIVVAAEDGERHLRVWDLQRETLTQLTFGPGAELFPVWTPDGRHVIYQSTPAEGPATILKTRVDGTAAAEPLMTNGGGPASVTPDGKMLVYRADPGVGRGMDTLLPLAGGTPQRLPLSQTTSPQINTQFSPDGRWIVYESHESGIEIFVRQFPGIDAGRWQISTASGQNPIWSPDGHEIFYESDEIEPNTLMRVAVQTGPTFRSGVPQPLFKLKSYMASGTLGMAYDISRDGKRFLMVKRGTQEVAAESTLVMVTNWFEELQTRLPTK